MLLLALPLLLSLLLLPLNLLMCAGGAPPRVPHEDAVLGGTLDDIIRCVTCVVQLLHQHQQTVTCRQPNLPANQFHLQWQIDQVGGKKHQRRIHLCPHKTCCSQNAHTHTIQCGRPAGPSGSASRAESHRCSRGVTCRPQGVHQTMPTPVCV